MKLLVSVSNLKAAIIHKILFSETCKISCSVSRIERKGCPNLGALLVYTFCCLHKTRSSIEVAHFRYLFPNGRAPLRQIVGRPVCFSKNEVVVYLGHGIIHCDAIRFC